MADVRFALDIGSLLESILPSGIPCESIMAAEVKKEIELEIAHVLFLDIVDYSKLSINEQHAAVEELNQIVRASKQFHRAVAASRLLKIPTGDGDGAGILHESGSACAMRGGD